MRLAASEKAYGPRKVAPVGMADDQMVWVVDPTGEGRSNLMYVSLTTSSVTGNGWDRAQ